MKFGDVMLRQKLYQEIIKHLMTSLLWSFYDVILYFGLCSAKKGENLNFFVFNPTCLKFGIGGNFEMLITKSNPKLRLENDLSRKLQFSTDFSQNFTEHPSTIALPWQQWMSHWMICIQDSSLLVYSKSQKVSAFYCLPFQRRRRKNQPVGWSPRPV